MVWGKKYFFTTLACAVLIAFLSSGQMKISFQKFLKSYEYLEFYKQHPLPIDDSFIGQIKYRIKGMISGKDVSFGIRLALWKAGWEIFKDYPLTGCGFRCVDLVNSQYPDPTGFVKRHRGMHNNFVQLAVDTGILGLTAWLGIWVYFFRLLYKRISALEGESDSQWIIWGSAASGVAFLVGGFFETNFYDSEVVMVLYFIMALPFAGSQNLKSEVSKDGHN